MTITTGARITNVNYLISRPCHGGQRFLARCGVVTFVHTVCSPRRMTCRAIQLGQSGNGHILGGVFPDREWLGSPKPALEMFSMLYEYVPLSHRTITGPRDDKQLPLSPASSSLDCYVFRTIQQYRLPTCTRSRTVSNLNASQMLFSSPH